MTKPTMHAGSLGMCGLAALMAATMISAGALAAEYFVATNGVDQSGVALSGF